MLRKGVTLWDWALGIAVVALGATTVSVPYLATELHRSGDSFSDKIVALLIGLAFIYIGLSCIFELPPCGPAADRQRASTPRDKLFTIALVLMMTVIVLPPYLSVQHREAVETFLMPVTGIVFVLAVLLRRRRRDT